MIGDNAPPPTDWRLPPRTKCCGLWQTGYSCGTCGEWLVDLPANIELGSE